jgi:hypothetical protein
MHYLSNIELLVSNFREIIESDEILVESLKLLIALLFKVCMFCFTYPSLFNKTEKIGKFVTFVTNKR